MQIYSLIFLYLAHIDSCLSYYYYHNIQYSYPENRYVQNPECCYYYYHPPPAPIFIPQAQYPTLAPFYLPYHTVNHRPNFGNYQFTGYPVYPFAFHYPSPRVPSVQVPSIQKHPRPAGVPTVESTTSAVVSAEPVIPELTTESSTTTDLSKSNFPGATTSEPFIDIDSTWPFGRRSSTDVIVEGSGGSATNDDED